MKVKICTNLEQSKKLVELGLSGVNTADMYYYNLGYTQVPRVIHSDHDRELVKCCLPAWSLSRLLDLMPKVGYHEEGMHKDSYKGWNLDQFRLRYDAKVTLADFDRHGIYDYVDIVFKCIVWLIENGKIDPKNITI